MQDVTAAWRRLAASPDDIARPLAHVIQALDARVIGIAGAPGAGKSTIAREIGRELTSGGLDPCVVSMDDYYLSKDERRSRGIEWRGPPGTHDVVGLLAMLDDVVSGTTPVTVKRFSPEIDDRIEPLILSSVPRPLILEGWVLGYRGEGYAEILDRLDLLVFVDVPIDVARKRRFDREAALHGGFSPDEMQRFWDEVLEPGLSRWVSDARTAADVVVEVRGDGGVQHASTSNPLVVTALTR
jgi:uridine kinase